MKPSNRLADINDDVNYVTVYSEEIFACKNIEETQKIPPASGTVVTAISEKRILYLLKSR